MTKKYITFDLREIARELGVHYGQVPESEHFDWCPECGEKVKQTDCACTGCGMPVVWKNSRTWKQEHGSPTVAIRRHRAIMPEDGAGKYLMKVAKLPGFKDRMEASRWEELVGVMSQSKLIETVRFCARKTRGRGLVKYALNAAEKAAEKLPSARENDEEWEVI